MARAPVSCCPPRPRPIAARPEHVAALKALAHLGRLRVFFHLVRAGRPLAVGDIQAGLRLPAPTLSHHLGHLERAGLIARRRDRRFIRSEVRPDTIADLVRLLTACC